MEESVDLETSGPFPFALRYATLTPGLPTFTPTACSPNKVRLFPSPTAAAFLGQDIVSYREGDLLRCPRCGNENPTGNRFCGMCGATLLSVSPPAPVHPAPQPVRPAAPPPAAGAPPAISHPAPDQTRAATRVEEETPSIAGPSFLGLSDPAPARRRGNLSIAPDTHSSNLDYLLDDVEEPKSSGAGKVFFILFALLLAVGFGYLRFRTHGFPWAPSAANKPAAAAPATSEVPTDASSASPSITPEPLPLASQPAATTQPASPSIQPAPANPPAAQTPPAAPENAATPTTADANPPAAAKPATAPGTDADSGKPADSSENSTQPGGTATEPAAAAPAGSSDAGGAAATAKPRAASKPIDPVAEAQRYIYGKGVSQDCDRGLHMLKPMANQGNTKAMVEMGALYSAGLCTPRDLPTSYRWFALALRKDPSNDSIQTDLQKLWGEMTQPERQLAIKLTQ